jgi:hypothetical protein
VTAASQIPSASSDYPQRSQAGIALVLGVAGLAVFGVFGPLAWLIASRELAAIDAGKRPPASRGTATAARLLGIVGTIVVLGAVLLFMLAYTGIIEVR